MWWLQSLKTKSRCFAPFPALTAILLLLSLPGSAMIYLNASPPGGCVVGRDEGQQQRIYREKKSVCITHTGKYLKPALVQIPHVSVRVADNFGSRLKH